MINERVKKEVIITESQTGGIEGSATADHLIAHRVKTAYVVFLDVQNLMIKPGWTQSYML